MKITLFLSVLLLTYVAKAHQVAVPDLLARKQVDTTENGIGQPAVPFVMTTPDGNELNSEKLKGKVVVLDFWATWCAPCRKLTHELDSLILNYHTKNDFQMIGANYRETNMSAAVTYWKEHHYAFPMAIVDPAYGKSIKAGNPTIIVIDQVGIVRGRWDKYTKATAEEVKKCIDNCLQLK